MYDINEFNYLTRSEKEALDLLIRKLKSTLNEQLIKIQLFGSKIRGDFREDSDIDLLIVVRERNQAVLDIIAEISLDVDLKYDPKISLIIFSVDEYEQNKVWGTPFIKSIEREGVLL